MPPDEVVTSACSAGTPSVTLPLTAAAVSVSPPMLSERSATSPAGTVEG